tara:strand:+ start:2194 stop:4056 length:1863 start_codon:yes stop_codon:yes gene_type:complete
MLIHLNEEKHLNSLPLFKKNTRILFSINDANYLTPGQHSLKEKLTLFLKKEAPTIDYTEAFLLTCPTFFGLNFNPVSFFYLLNSSQDIIAVIAEVHNTYKEKHLYLLTNPIEKKGYLNFETVKNFHVSPFFTVDGKYRFIFSKNMDNIEITINYFKGNQHMFNANLKLTTAPLNGKRLMLMSGNYIHTAVTTFPRILIQAAILKFKHRLPHFKNQGLKSPNSFSRKSPTMIHKLAISLLNKYLKKIDTHGLEIKCPDGKLLSYGQPSSKKLATINVLDYRFFNLLVLKSDIGLADAYIKKYWDTDSLETVFEVFIANESLLKTSNVFISFSRMINKIQHHLRKNNISKAKKNIYEHYDLGNRFFELFLDKNRVYSSAIYSSPSESLEDAQINKINQALTMADVQPSHRILEIGSGWGALAIHAATTIGCHVTTVTISEEQYNHVKAEINKRHLDALIEVKLMDYRLLSGKYDRIISIEMLEAVGHDYLTTYFKKCYDLLKRNGKAMFQCIMIPDNRYESYRNSQDFIQKYIFPGGHLPSMTAIKKASKTANFNWTMSTTITDHYVKTLRTWEQTFLEKKDQILNMGFDNKFIQTWVYYFNYCSAGFNANFIHNEQFVIEK